MKKNILSIIKEELSYILFEYSLLFFVLCLVGKEANEVFYIITILIISTRHYKMKENVYIVESNNKDIIYTRSDSRKSFSFFDKFTIIIMMIIYSDYYPNTDIYFFFVWFVLTDIFRQRKTMNGNYISRWFYVSNIQINNSKWELHKADDDFWPSVPHMHSIEFPLKLNIYTGEIYNTHTRKRVEKVKRKNLKKLWKDREFRNIVDEARSVYIKKNPNYKLEELPLFLNDY